MLRVLSNRWSLRRREKSSALRQFSVEEENTTQSTTASASTGEGTSEVIQKRKSVVTVTSDNGANPIQEVDYDALYDEQCEDLDMGSIENHGSVITHVLSQVKIGMDLTKVVLPIYILERRSLLEMYADYFTHPDLFVKIADLKDPRDRMVQVIRWYLSSYHAGRKSCVAKKPYNPVLGEVFKCHWNVPGYTKVNAEGATNADGPIPWCNNDQLSFVAEQVSHHPPISAFYAEHVDKKISFTANVYTKSKFLGLSICVYNIGQGVISVLDYNEEYILTFPNGYGRSILTVPWTELGGSVTVTCEKTGYRCNIEFLTKPFYGNKKHRITAEVFGPSEKKPFLSIHGEWNGVMEARWTEKNESEIFIDVNNLETVHKNVRPISQQDSNESRYLWREVTAGLKFNDIEKASKAKTFIEQNQRDLVKERQENNEPWQTKLFKQNEKENWQYINPLSNRLSQQMQGNS